MHRTRVPRRALACVAAGGNKVAEILQAKLLDGHRTSFVRSKGELFVVGVRGEERTIPGTPGDYLLSVRPVRKTGLNI